MLVLTRKQGERILVGDDIVVSILDVRGDSIRIGIQAPRGLRIQREEVVQAVIEANVAAAGADGADDERIVGQLLAARGSSDAS